MLAAMAHYVAFCQQFAELRIWAFLTHASSRNLNFLHISICVWLIEIPTRESEDWFGLIQKSSETKLVAYYTIFL